MNVVDTPLSIRRGFPGLKLIRKFCKGSWELFICNIVLVTAQLQITSAYQNALQNVSRNELCSIMWKWNLAAQNIPEKYAGENVWEMWDMRMLSGFEMIQFFLFLSFSYSVLYCNFIDVLKYFVTLSSQQDFLRNMYD